MFDLLGFVMQHLQLGRSGRDWAGLRRSGQDWAGLGSSDLVWSSSRDGIRRIHVVQHYGVAASLRAVATA